jgi:hypothetical protein
MTSIELTRKCPGCLKKFSITVNSRDFIPIYCSSKCQTDLESQLGLGPDLTLSGIPKQTDPHLALVRHSYFRRVKLYKLQDDGDEEKEEEKKRNEQ